MSVEIGLWGVAILMGLLALRLPVALALILVSFGGIWAMLGWNPAMGILANTPYSFAARWTMSAVPMFLLMGFVAYHTGLTGGLFDAAKALLARLPGGLAISSIFACSAFAAVSGSSLANSAAMGRIAIPEMVKAGYRPSIAAGCIAAGGTIGALIPPSILMIIYGVIAETSIVQVFLGGISIGLITALSYCIVVLCIAWFRPDIIPPTGAVEPPDLWQSLRQVLPIVLLIILVFGGLFSGMFTATQAGAVGAFGTVALAAAMGRLTRDVIRRSLNETVITTSSLLIIGIGATMFTRFLGISGVSNLIASFVSDSGMSMMLVLLIIICIYLLLGTFMEPFGAMLVTLPIFLPLIDAQGLSLVWFGVLVVKLLEVGMITPPVGMNVFVIKNVASRYVMVTDVFRGVLPFILADLVVVALIVAVPSLVLFLPELVSGAR
ncbi:TRAP transporter large permease [Roseinatronobacter bogoriensis]|uniref:TRAP transporter large permease protein n=1 Tax=Roseinatronobacter bogoriensis subsp. barguzinensis TaxID=441209 RepID=A0A2K8K8A4_9RHOB|nr:MULTISPECIES: TRAP transporter large permease subunit [Rhodobaca]ATX65677.1 C4-dicarboxylate ABC transporter [Rhodobaca barguzinensis]MBB4208382.1 tripartite ATP-independent transporter DctM subunit [Rhodobaca bogoriensis DSM 18756]TDW39023.1 tripartite ATP-independent transporter DctM subunit [Rhodobaca barguzinensis]TDY68794.1 tripartite ATP-independent transporter DctM subunit [Rhodobaca bogoriensis DSM 18756]